MLNGTGLDDLCSIGNDSQALKTKLPELFATEISEEDIRKREEVLTELYSNSKNAERLIGLVWE
jgi:hypothetical protein